MSKYKKIISKENASLGFKFSVDDSKCDNPQHYNDYIKFSALQDLNDGLGVTYLYIEYIEEKQEEFIMGYVSLRMSSLIKDMGEDKKFGYPALEIAELAVDKRYTNKHIGTDMVLDSINTANLLNDTASVKYLVLCADPKAVEFYKKIDFNELINETGEIPREHCNIRCTPMLIKLR